MNPHAELPPRAQLGDLVYRVREALAAEEASDPAGPTARLLRDMLDYVDAPPTTRVRGLRDTMLDRLHRQVYLYRGRSLRWHAERLGVDADQLRHLMYDLEERGAVHRRPFTALFLGPKP
ncbi:hypothetical protein DM785_02460 [Deinococcus actinosclerus]|nr:hypothetical protein DM785_02460 [Deinococcus actinosclerus]